MNTKRKTRDKKSYYAKIMIFISLIFLCIGLLIDVRSNTRLIHPEKEVKAINDDGNRHVSVDNANGNNSKDSVRENETGVEDNNVNQNTKQNEDVNDNSSSDSNSTESDNIRNDILKKYGINVKYGNQTEGYNVAGYSTVAITDPGVVNTSLKELNKVLGLYPKGLFKEIKNGGIPLTIYLINNYSDATITGATDSNYSKATMSISAIYPIGETFYHESYHYIERYIYKLGLSFNSLVWDSYNPPEFNYGSQYNDYSYSVTFSENSYFVNNYAQTDVGEDRASTFEYMMASSKASCLNYEKPIWKKASLISKTIDAALDSVKPNVTEHWERYL